ncbi:FAD:protein FMN transferase [Desulfuribacillus alkaliarsenatis]|uniref:FAD:protein FMN transferase n=1 Tax=Desulfuribacillus alkaliarsenatis TaxID=766136 RepID=A0A1E5G5X0_9FIRM|nr:FAD:protein FMN transferase [Desulfuribacillus alkaliarsenatis]OEF98164.1 thiamine biosynthesis protein ApbE [Desulfuribacillus alkaliarsenatis]
MILAKRFFIVLLLLTLVLTGCSKESQQVEYQRYATNFLDTFDTVVQVIGFTESEAEFYEYVDEIESRFWDFHKLFDKYNTYTGINNVKTINDNAGIQPVEVEQEIIDLILFAKEWYGRTYGKMNIAAGSLIKVWDDVMEHALYVDYDSAYLPPQADLEIASEHIDINNIIVDEQAMTVYLADSNMSLDFGAIAKGYAAEIVGREMIEKGFISGAIISGGNWKILGEPLASDRDYWIAAIQNPDVPYALDESGILERVQLTDQSIDTSGDYQRYVMVEDIRVHHIIDPDTLMPGNYHRGVTVLAENSGIADYLSTELFLLPYDKGRDLVDSLTEIEALWVLDDGTVVMTEGMQSHVRSNNQ